MVGRVFHHGYAGLRRAGERHLVYAWVAHQRTASLLSEARDHVDDAWREARLFEELREFQDGGRRLLGGFHNYRAARGERWRQLEGQKEQRRVPRHDGADDPNWLSSRVDEEVRLIRGDSLALDLIRRPSEVVVPLGQRPQLAAHFPEEFPVVRALNGSQLLRVLGQEVSEPPHQARPLGAGHRAPGSFVEGRAGGSYSPVHVLFVRLGGGGPHPARVRVDALEGISGEGVYLLAPDQHLVIAHLAGRWGFDQPRLHVLSSSGATTSATL